MVRRTPRRGFLRTIVAAAVLAGPVGARAGQVLDLQLREGRLSAHVVGAPLAAVLARIATLSGASVTGVDASEPTLATATFNELPLEDALDRLLQGRNHYVVQARNGHLRRIVILGGGSAVITPAVTADRAPATPESLAAAPSENGADPMLAGTVQLLTAAVLLDEPGLRRQILDDVATWRSDDPSRALVLARLADDPDSAVREEALALLRAKPAGRSGRSTSVEEAS